MNIGSLKPRQVFDIAHKWSKDYVKNLNPRLSKFESPFHVFLTRGTENWKITCN